MPKKSPAELLPIYRATLARYEATNDVNTEVQRRLIAQLEKDV